MNVNEPAIPPFTFAFQPVIDAATGVLYSQEALVRGLDGQSAGAVFKAIDSALLSEADRAFCIGAIELAAELGLASTINLNVMPSSLGRSPEAIAALLKTAERVGIAAELLLLEITESEIIVDLKAFAKIVNEYRCLGLKFAIDDFGAGYAGLNLLAEFQSDVVKVDMHLVRGIDSRGPRQAIVRGIARTCMDLGIDIIAEGVETKEEFYWFMDEGITLFQGYLFAKPAFRTLASSFYLPPYPPVSGG